VGQSALRNCHVWVGARARHRTRRVHGIDATCVTAHKPPFPNSRIMLLISVRLSITKFQPEQRDVQRWNDTIACSIEHGARKTARTNPCNEVAGRLLSILETPMTATR